MMIEEQREDNVGMLGLYSNEDKYDENGDDDKDKDEEEKVGQDGGLGLYSPSSPLLPLSPLQRRLLRSISKDPVSLVESNLFAGKNGTALVLECHAIRSTRITSKNKHQQIQRERQQLDLLVYVSLLCWLYIAVYFRCNDNMTL